MLYIFFIEIYLNLTSVSRGILTGLKEKYGKPLEDWQVAKDNLRAAAAASLKYPVTIPHIFACTPAHGVLSSEQLRGAVVSALRPQGDV